MGLKDKDTENFNDTNMKNYNRSNITIVLHNITNKANMLLILKWRIILRNL